MDDAMERRLVAAEDARALEAMERIPGTGGPKHVRRTGVAVHPPGVRPHQVASDFHASLTSATPYAAPNDDPMLVRPGRRTDQHRPDRQLEHDTSRRARGSGRPGQGGLRRGLRRRQGLSAPWVGTVLESGQSEHIVGLEYFLRVAADLLLRRATDRDLLSGRIEGLDVSVAPAYERAAMHRPLRHSINNLLHSSQPEQALFHAARASMPPPGSGDGGRTACRHGEHRRRDAVDRHHQGPGCHTRLRWRDNMVDNELDLLGSQGLIRGSRATAWAEIAGMIVVATGARRGATAVPPPADLRGGAGRVDETERRDSHTVRKRRTASRSA